jgi:lipopolysaccharide assembly outer membrane protein LptD (OstA)
LNKAFKKLSLIIIAFMTLSCQLVALDFDLGKKSALQEFRNIKADHWSMVGKNIIVSGDVHIPYGEFTVYADKAIVNFETKDFEASGNIRIYEVRKESSFVNIDKLAELSSFPQTIVDIKGYSVTPDGEQKVNVDITYRGNMFKASKVTGNLSSGYFKFTDFVGRYQTFTMKAKSGTRRPGGEIIVKDAEVSSCKYLDNDNSHYSVKCASLRLSPQQTSGFGVSGGRDFGDHTLWAENCSYNIYGVPVLWVPFVYKPKDESLGLVHMQGGYNSDWGGFLLFSKRYNLSDSPYSTVKLLADYYTERGFGYGADAEVLTEFSKTRIFGYSIYDIKPYRTTEDNPSHRLEIPHSRYNVRINNVTHITPRLDFRGQFQLLSDYYFLNDFFKSQYNNNPEPATYAAMEYQFDRFTASVFARAQTNDFFNTVQEMPTFRLNFPRQELFSDIYWEGQTSLGYYKMNWTQFDRPRTLGNGVDPKNYKSARFDTVNMFFYNLKLKNFSLIPRAGVRLTYYSDSSKRKISSQQLGAMWAVSQPEGNSSDIIVNYDDKGGNKVRFIGEIGLEGTGKISRSWLDVRNAYWRLDGLRHIIEPYFNYTYIPEPSVDRDHIYNFDEIDRIERQNFVRLGLRNRLQTRRGGFEKGIIYNWFNMENYWDYHFETNGNLDNVGDFVTKIYFNPSEKLSFLSFFSVDVAQDERIPQNPTEGGNSKGLGFDWLNKWEIMAKYQLTEDINFFMSYVLQNPYKTHSVYSMGSNFTEIQGGGVFDQYYNSYVENVRFGVGAPLTLDRKTRAEYEFYYDFQAGYIRQQQIRILRDLHCWQAALELASNTQRESDSGDKDTAFTAMLTLTLTDMQTPMKKIHRQTVNMFTNVIQGEGK